MKHEIPIRIRVLDPPSGVIMQVQRGKDELLSAASAIEAELVFDLSVDVDLSSSEPNFLGKYAQGPKDARFIYVNSGTSAGQLDSCWTRRAKLSLMRITAKQIEEIIAVPGSRLETSFNGIGRDGGPTCASVKGIEWTVASK